MVLLGAILLGGAGYLLLHADTATSGFSAEAARSGGAPAGPPTARSGRPLRRPGASASRGRTSSPLLSDRSGTGPSGPPAPFSESWRREATPSLGGPAASPGASSGGTAGNGTAGSAAGGAGPRPEGSSIAEARPGGATGTGGASHGSTVRPGTDWRAEARRLGGQARALSGALRQFQEGGSETSRKRSGQQGSAGATASGGQVTSSDRDVPNPPPPVPIDDHLYWLVVAGLLWGAWRIGQGA